MESEISACNASFASATEAAEANRRLPDGLDFETQLEGLRRFGLWNAAAVVKILKKFRKRGGSLEHDESVYLVKQNFFDLYPKLQASNNSCCLCGSKLPGSLPCGHCCCSSCIASADACPICQVDEKIHSASRVQGRGEVLLGPNGMKVKSYLWKLNESEISSAESIRGCVIGALSHKNLEEGNVQLMTSRGIFPLRVTRENLDLPCPRSQSK